jgi:ABC-type lipoprotein release transport system permease subunit
MKLRRHLNLWAAAATNLTRWRGRTISIAVPLATIMAVASAMTFVKYGCQRDAELSASMLPDLTVQQLLAGRVDRVDLSVTDRIRRLPHVEKVVPRVWGYIPLRANQRDLAYTIMGIDPQRMPIDADIGLAIQHGRFLRAGETGKAVIGRAFARAQSADVGDLIRLRSPLGRETSFEIVGVFSSPVQIYTADLMVVPVDDARMFFGYLDTEASDLCVYLDDEVHADSVAASIAASGRDLRVLSRDALKDLVSQAYGGRSGVFQILWLVMLVTVMLLGWAQASSVSLQMRKEIGVLKAIGWDTGDITEVKLLEAAIIGVGATVVGIALGLAYLMAGAPGIKQYFLGWAAVYPQFPLPLFVRAQSLVWLLAIGVFPLLGATVVPSWLAAIAEPDEAIRSA